MSGMADEGGRRLPFRRERADTVRSLGRWALVAAVDVLGLARHRVMWTASARLEDDELWLPNLDRPLPGDPSTLQRAADGVGDLHVRRYRLVVATDRTVADAVELLRDDLDSLVPERFVWFRDAEGRPVGSIEVGDEFVARLAGPRDGPVRTVEVTEDGYRLATLRGHVEAGEIRFRVERLGPQRLGVEIRSWARSGSEDVRLLYERGGGQQVQAHVWTSLCLALADRLDGRAVGRVEIASRRLDWPPSGRTRRA